MKNAFLNLSVTGLLLAGAMLFTAYSPPQDSTRQQKKKNRSGVVSPTDPKSDVRMQENPVLHQPDTPPTPVPLPPDTGRMH